MVECEICGANINNPKHHSHINSKKHQEALSKKNTIEDLIELNTSLKMELLEDDVTVKEVRNPGDLNIMISHFERCGVSWFCLYISLVHEQMYGELKKWNIRTSRVRAARKKYDMPLGWNTTRYVSIHDLVKKPYDKIILLQRRFDNLEKSVFKYRFTGKDYDTAKEDPALKWWFERFEKYYFKTYGNSNDERVLRVYLEDVNNYTEAMYDEVLDFLGYPKVKRPTYDSLKTLVDTWVDAIKDPKELAEKIWSYIISIRPHILAVNPNRVWDAVSATLNKGQAINKRLLDIQESESDIQLEFILPEKSNIASSSDIIGHENGLLDIEKKIQDKWQVSMNPIAKITDALDIIQDEKVLNVVIIGSLGAGLGCHFSEHISRVLKEMGVDTCFLDIPQLARGLHVNLKQYHVSDPNRKWMPLSKILHEFGLDPDLVFIDGSRFCIDNDTHKIAFYSHRGWHLPFVVKNANAVFMPTDHYRDVRKASGVSCYLDTLSPSTDMKEFIPKKKVIREVMGIGYRRSYESWRKIVSRYEGYESLVNLIEAETDVFKACGYKYFDTPIDDLEYRKILRTSQYFWFPVPFGQHVTRRMLDAMAAKCLCIFRIDDAKHQGYLKKLKFVNGIHYIGLKNISDIVNIEDKIKEVDVEKMVDAAYKAVRTYHTHEMRGRQILRLYEGKFGGVVHE